MERRFNDQLRAHEDDRLAHSPERHDFINRTIVPMRRELEQDLREHVRDPDAHSQAASEERSQLKTLWEERLVMKGEIQLLRRLVAGGFAFLTLAISVAAVIVAVK